MAFMFQNPNSRIKTCKILKVDCKTGLELQLLRKTDWPPGEGDGCSTRLGNEAPSVQQLNGIKQLVIIHSAVQSD